MQASFEWIRQYIDPKKSAQECAEAMTMLGFPLDAIEEVGGDTVMEFDVTTNRPDAMNHLGLARELSAKFQVPLRFKTPSFAPEGRIDIEIKDSELCPRYSARRLEGVKNGPTPALIKTRLERIGQRSINGIVDITNYVLFELGHPLHAFDFSNIGGQKIIVRRAKKNEPFKTLDGVDRKLCDSMLVIADAKRPVALAGVMGGFDSEVGMDTTDVLLESAYFAPQSIRKTSKTFDLHTEASHRFERGADYGITMVALDRCCELILEHFGGTVTAENDCVAKKIEQVELDIRLERMRRFFGNAPELADDWIKSMLPRLGFEILSADSEKIRVRVPSFRSDVEREIDVYEEVLRVYGYNKVIPEYPRPYKPSEGLPPHIALSRRIRKRMTSLGYQECVNYSMVDPVYEDKLGADETQAVSLRNPLSEDASRLRQSLFQGLLKNLSLNLNRGQKDIRLFEIGKSFHNAPKAKDAAADEVLQLAGLVTGSRQPAHWSEEESAVDFYDTLGVLEQMMLSLGIMPENFSFQPLESGIRKAAHADLAWFSESECIRIELAGQSLGLAGRLCPQRLEAFSLDGKTVFGFHLDLDNLEEASGRSPRFEPLPKRLPLVRNLSFLSDANLNYAEIMDTIRSSDWPYVSKVTVADVFEGPPLPDGKKSITLDVVFQPGDDNLTESDVADVERKMVKMLENKLNLKLRGSL